MKPVALQYPGGKSPASSTALNQWINDLLPAADHYCEPFAGMCGVLLGRSPAVSKHETVNDLDDLIYGWWQVVRDRHDELIEWLENTPNGREQFAESQTLLYIGAPLGDVAKAGHVTVALGQGFMSGGLKGRPARGSWSRKLNVATGTHTAWANIADKVKRLTVRMRFVALENRDAVTVIGEYGRYPCNVLYVDPPYENVPDYYRATVDFDAMETVLADCQAHVAISGYPSCRWDSLGWHRNELPVKSFVGRVTETGVDTSAQARTEVLWTNYDPSTVDNRLF